LISATLARQSAGIVVLVLGCLALAAPLLAGRQATFLLGLLVLGSGLLRGGQMLRQRAGESAFFSGTLSFLIGLLLLAAPRLAVTGLAWLLGGSFVLDGLWKIGTALWRPDLPAARSALARGALAIAFGAMIVVQWPVSGTLALGVFVGLHILADGWALLVGRLDPAVDAAAELSLHPDTSLELPAHAEIARLQEEARARDAARRHIDRYWLGVFIAIFFAIHVGRMDADWTLVGLLSPAVAVAGDVLFALALAYCIITPARLTWRRATRRAERGAWQRLLARIDQGAPLRFYERPIRWWLLSRLDFARQLDAVRQSPRAALRHGLELGLPLVAILVALNPIWGFSWYFNTENWATEIWDHWAEQRTDHWREEMMRAVRTQYARPLDELLQVRPAGIDDQEDFSFMVIGDPGTGDPSQHALRDQIIELGDRPDMRFLIVASDVIYPAGAMKDYERNFYLPFMGFHKPIYAIPGNHDWYDALEGFAANFFEPDAARAAVRARVAADRGLTSTTEARIGELIDEAARLRREYGLEVARQRGPYFEIQADRFALIMVDTGVLRSVDDEQRDWLKGALERSRGKFTMVIAGHPFFAAGLYQGAADKPFAALHRLLREKGVSVVMAGDTHDLEYYREPPAPDGKDRAMHHFVNGGGGAYLSIGTALDWPSEPALPDCAFYPRSDQLAAKLAAQMPLWKGPLWFWVYRLGAWPSTPEMMAAAFDYNRAPFFQSLVLVEVQRSARRVRFLPYGVRGRLRWRDLQVFGRVLPAGKSGDDFVEFEVAME
jgi:uncharacterized membrane protein HdeD (DUF308 family)